MKMFLILVLSVTALFVWQRSNQETTKKDQPAPTTKASTVSEHDWAKHSLDRTTIIGILERKGQPERRKLRSGLVLLLDVPGSGEPVRRQHSYIVRLRMWLHRGDPVRWEDGDETLTEIRISRGSMMSGLFYGIEGMRVGGTRRLEIAPHLSYGEEGVPGRIPPNALLTAEIKVLAAVDAPA